jgi:outer membrane protein OmpU
MKKVLLASTALVLSAGVAAADVTTSGSGRIGIVDTIAGDDIAFTSRVRIAFSGAGETSGGLAFGGSIRADNAGNGNSGTAGSVFISGDFGRLTSGDVSGAPEQAVGDLSGVGLTGLGDYSDMSYLSNSGAAVRPAIRYDYSFGDFGVHVSADNPFPAGDQAFGVAVSYSGGLFDAGLGYEAVGDDNHIIGGVEVAFAGATVKVIYGQADVGGVDLTQVGASVDVEFGATTVTAFFSDNEIRGGAQEAFGVGVDYDLGGATLSAGYVDADTDGDGFDFGISFSF